MSCFLKVREVENFTLRKSSDDILTASQVIDIMGVCVCRSLFLIFMD